MCSHLHLPRSRGFQTLILLLAFPSILFSQTTERDSLLARLQEQARDTNNVKTMYSLVRYYEKSNLDSAVYYLEKLRKLSTELSYEKGQVLYHERMAVVAFTNGDHQKALRESELGLGIARKLKETGSEIAMLNMLAICNQYLGKYEDELNYVLQAQAKAEQAGDKEKMVQLYHSLCNAYSDLGQSRKAIDAALTGLRLRDLYQTKAPYFNRLYSSLAQEYQHIGVIDSADHFYKKAITASKEINDVFAEGMIYKFVTNFYSGLGKYEKMRGMAEKSLALAKELKSRKMEASAYYSLAAANYYTNNNQQARRFLDQSLGIAIEDSIRDELLNGYRLLSYITAREGDYPASAKSQGIADSLQQAGLNEEVAKSAADLEKKYETEKKENQIKLQTVSIRQKNFLNYILMGGVAAILVIALLAYRNHRNKQKLQQQRISELETERQLLSTQSLLKGQEDERSRLAKDLHDGLGGLLSGVKLQLGAMKGNLILSEENGRSFNLALTKLDESISEMRRVAHNMMPEALLNMGLQQALQDYCDGLSESLPSPIHTEFHGLEERMEPSIEIVLYRIVQELLNNVIKHAQATIIVAQVIRQNNLISITVEDNGKGFAVKAMEEFRTAGIRNIQSRVNYLHGQLDIQSTPGKGTSVHIECLIEYNEQQQG
ncbi:sensor histidine kinase [Terrimonas sp. NA20]|uniref:Sensor histidine kinase n=1 Tax=Terrimonas ginsenosidimutans TaxID=2908004 RepID=A0ABS9KUK9_9BACT|nr:sensor histidine kinase [Terrimonas ginsenosidimutans]MCG2616008.1 sensor histidine kinase [Terrimonas ginsenosidimutans]